MGGRNNFNNSPIIDEPQQRFGGPPEEEEEELQRLQEELMMRRMRMREEEERRMNRNDGPMPQGPGGGGQSPSFQGQQQQQRGDNPMMRGLPNDLVTPPRGSRVPPRGSDGPRISQQDQNMMGGDGGRRRPQVDQMMGNSGGRGRPDSQNMMGGRGGGRGQDMMMGGRGGRGPQDRMMGGRGGGGPDPMMGGRGGGRGGGPDRNMMGGRGGRGGPGPMMGGRGGGGPMEGRFSPPPPPGRDGPMPPPPGLDEPGYGDMRGNPFQMRDPRMGGPDGPRVGAAPSFGGPGMGGPRGRSAPSFGGGGPGVVAGPRGGVGVPPPPFNEPPVPFPRQQAQQQQQRPKTFYEILQVPRTATRAQIKQSYTNLARKYDVNTSGPGGGSSEAAVRNNGKRNSREFNEIARAWMVLSDLASRERYDRQLEMEDEEEEEYRRRMMMMEGRGMMMDDEEEERERLWMVNEQERRRRRMMDFDDEFDDDNKFKRRGKPMDDVDEDDRNKFQQREWNMGARPLTIDEDAELMAQRHAQEQAEKAEQDAMLQKKAREMQKRKFEEDRKREERRRASSERDVVQDKKPAEFGQQQQQQDLNVLMGNMKKKFGEKKMDEASRVQEELKRMQSMGGRNPPAGSVGGSAADASRAPASSTASRPQRSPGSAGHRGVLFPGKGGIVVEDQQFVAKDILLDKMMGRDSSAKSPPSQEQPNQPKQAKFISYVPPEDENAGMPDNFQAPPARGQPAPISGDREREQERLRNIKTTGMGKPQQPSGPFAPPNTGGPPPPMKTSTNTREQQRLQNLNPFSKQAAPSTTERSTLPGPNAPPSPMKTSTTAQAEKKLEEEIVNIAKIHASEINKLREQLDGRGVRPGPGLDDEIRMLKMAQKSELERTKQEIAQAMENDHAERMKKLEAAHEAEIDQILTDSDGAVSRLRSEIKALKEAHAAALESMTATHEYEMQQLRADLETRSMELSQSHQEEIEKLTQSGKAASVASTLHFQKKSMDNLNVQHQKEIQAMVTHHEADMEQLRKDLEAKSIRDTRSKVEEVTKSMAAKHKADMDAMAAQHRQQMESLVQSELNRLHKEHLQELDEARAEKMRLQRKAERATRELNKSDSTMSESQKLEMVLDSFEGVYDQSVIRKLKQDVKARETELNNKIAQSSQQIYTLQLKLDTNKDAEKKLKFELNALTQWKKNAEEELRNMRQREQDKSNEVVTLNKTIETMNKEISQLQGQLDRVTKESDANKKQISELTQWKKTAEMERLQLEKELKAKDVQIGDLQYSLDEANIDIAILVPEVARLQEIEKSLNGLVEKSAVDFKELKEKADALKTQYEKENRSSGDEVQKLKILLSSEQAKSTESIQKLKDELRVKENEISKMQSSTGERSKTIADMEAKLEQARRQSERSFEENKKKIESMNAAFKKELERNKAVHQAELERLKQNLQKDISSLQQDLNARSNVITDLKAKLDASTTSNKQLQGEVVGLQNARRSTEAMLKESSQSLQKSEQEIERLTKQFQMVKQSDASNNAKIESLRTELNDKSALLNRLQAEVNSSSSEKERLLTELKQLTQWKEDSLAALNKLYSQVSQKQGGKVDDISEMVARIKIELSQKDTQLNQAKSAAASLLNKQGVVGRTTSSAAPVQAPVKLPFTQGQEIGFGFSARTKRTSSPSQNTAPSTSQSSAAVDQQPSGSGPMSGWTGYKNKQWGGYLDNLSQPAQSTTLTAAPVSKKSDYKEAERKYLLEAKSLAAVVLQSFENARKLKGQGQTYQDALAKANQEKAKVDDLLARAREMKELNERTSMSP
eukprot:scaffold5819_cov148-Skeletonema_menzelii.AAC.8